MKTHQSCLGAVLAFGLTLFISSEGEGSAAPQPRRGLLGGYHPGNVNDVFVLSAAEFAVTAVVQGETTPGYYSFALPLVQQNAVESTGEDTDDPLSGLHVDVTDVLEQVVAGLNYKMTVAISDDSGCVGAFKAEIYNQFGDMQVTHWGEEVSCTDAMAMLENIQN